MTNKTIDILIPFNEDLKGHLQKKIGSDVSYEIISRSLDARGAPHGKVPHYLYKLHLIENEVANKIDSSLPTIKWNGNKPIIIGAGPAGLFAAYRFLQYGIRSILIERGKEADQRMSDISLFWKQGVFNEESNVCFGAGGAGLFSDGKLVTRVKSSLVKEVMAFLSQMGAPHEVNFDTHPHIGTNRLRIIINNIIKHLRDSGCEMHFEKKVSEIVCKDQKIIGVKDSKGNLFESNYVILATGHSAHNIYEELYKKNVALKRKDFAIGVRVEHEREFIDRSQYGAFVGEELGAAAYRLSHHDNKTGRGTYSFCMCPGGMVVSSGSNANGLVTNGMSNSKRNSRWSNSAIIVSVQHDKDFPNNSPLDGLSFIKRIEQKAFEQSVQRSSGRGLPAVRSSDFMKGKQTSTLPENSSPSSLVSGKLEEILPPFVCDHIKRGMLQFEKSIKGFLSVDPLLIAPETRTSSPVEITRDHQTLESVGLKGLYPCGEGAGYAGGITSSAIDGMRVVDAIIANLK